MSVKSQGPCINRSKVDDPPVTTDVPYGVSASLESHRATGSNRDRSRN